MACGESEWSETATDAELARIRCGSCHLAPEPSLLPKDKWANLLPNMGARLGIKTEGYDPLADKSMKRQFKLQAANIYPPSPLISEKEWKRIYDYFLDESPDRLELPVEKAPGTSKLFQSHFPEMDFPGPPSITVIKYDTAEKAFYLGARSGFFGKLNQDLTFDYNIRLPRPIVDVAKGAEAKLRLLSIGELYPDESSQGAMIEFRETKIGVQKILLNQLPRPVSFMPTDLDQDGQDDFLVCAFGNQIGKFSWFKPEGSRYVETVLKEVSGATRAFVSDLDGDGSDDLAVLFAQGDEGVSIFYKKKGNFREERVLRFHPAFGSSDMEFVDFDGDGDMDIVLSNGDNGDYSNVLKPYHGVRIFLNDGQQHFEEQFFYPMYGAAKVRCRDFDLDGDTDLFVMSFFPDFDRGSAQSLLYLENQGNWKFTPYQIEGADSGRWMVMDAGDIDQDGDEDLLLGSFTLNSTGVDPVLMENWKKSGKHILYLENTTQ